MHVCQIRNECFKFSQFEREMIVKSFKIYCISRFVYNPLDKIKQYTKCRRDQTACFNFLKPFGRLGDKKESNLKFINIPLGLASRFRYLLRINDFKISGDTLGDRWAFASREANCVLLFYAVLFSGNLREHFRIFELVKEHA